MIDSLTKLIIAIDRLTTPSPVRMLRRARRLEEKASRRLDRCEAAEERGNLDLAEWHHRASVRASVKAKRLREDAQLIASNTLLDVMLKRLAKRMRPEPRDVQTKWSIQKGQKP